MSFLTEEQADRAKGCFIGLFIGDALGTTLEFSKRDSLPFHDEITGGGPFNLERGDWTDDGAMALGLASALIDHEGEFNSETIMSNWLDWFKQGKFSSNGRCFDIGCTTRFALQTYEQGGDPNSCTIKRGDGNGSLMRLCPIVIANLRQGKKHCQHLAQSQSLLTHGGKGSYNNSWKLAGLLYDLIMSGRLSLRSKEITHFKEKLREDVSSSGYSVHTMDVALWCLVNTYTFEQALTLAVNLGDDSDTVGAVTGQLAGAWYGFDQIPKRWWDAMKWQDYLENYAEELILLNEITDAP